MPRQSVIQPGQKYGEWTVIEFVERKGSCYYWLCQCSCLKTKPVQHTHLRSGKSTKCVDCYKQSRSGEGNPNYRHGKAKDRVYKIWADMRERCCNPDKKNYDRYGGRGIAVCNEWLTSFEQFYKDMGDPPTAKHQLDREDNNGNYTPKNCRWVTPKVNQNNKSTNRVITYNNESKTLTEWAETLNLSFSLVSDRLNRGWSVEDAFETPKLHQSEAKYANQVTYHGKTACLSEWERVTGLSRGTIRKRLNAGWPVEQALTTRIRKRRSDAKKPYPVGLPLLGG